MSYRVLQLVLGVVGALVVLALVLFGARPGGLTAKGPRPKRALLSAGIALLAALGICVELGSLGCAERQASIPTGAPRDSEPEERDVAVDAPAPVRSAASAPSGPRIPDAAIQRLAAVCKRAESYLAGDPPLNLHSNTEQRNLLRALEAALVSVASMQSSGQMGPAEAALVDKHLRRLFARVRAPRFASMFCYVQTQLPSEPLTQLDSVKWLGDRLSLLERALEAGRLHPTVLSKVLQAMESDLRDVESMLKVNDLFFDRQAATARRVAKKARRLLHRLKRRLSVPSVPGPPRPSLTP